MDARTQKREIAAILAAGYWRFLCSDTAKSLKHSQLKNEILSESRCYAAPPE